MLGIYLFYFGSLDIIPVLTLARRQIQLEEAPYQELWRRVFREK
jgi:hypothetical protein